jgi:predicted component of type VI protein secretion system
LSKPIQEQIFKSRLTITYRTNVSGTVQQEKLPYRVLVLGEFSGRSLRQDDLLPDLTKRPVRSIKRGTTVNDHLSEVVPTWRVPQGDAFHALRSAVPGQVVFDSVRCVIPVGALDRGEGKGYSLSGTAHFTSSVEDNGMCDVAGDLVVGGTLKVNIQDKVATAEDATLLLFGVVSGNYVDPATGKITGVVTGHVNQSIRVAAGAVKMRPASELPGAPDEGDSKTRIFAIEVGSQPAQAERSIPFPSIEAFTPDAVAASIPEVHRLRVIKQLLLELQSGLRNRPELRKQMKAMLPGYGESKDKISEKLAPFTDLKAWAEESFPLLKIERGAAK